MSKEEKYWSVSDIATKGQRNLYKGSYESCKNDLKKLFPIKSWNKLHLQFIFYGRSNCTARGCDGTVCEICKFCFPERKKPIITNKA